VLLRAKPELIAKLTPAGKALHSSR
jgi:hypothetical protein